MTNPTDTLAEAVTDPTTVLVEAVAERVIAHPSVVSLAGGPWNSIATYLPGRRLAGIRIPSNAERVEVGVVLRLSRPLLDVAAELRREISALCGGVPVDITVVDVAVHLEDGG